MGTVIKKNRIRRGRPKKDPKDRCESVSITIPVAFIDEIAYDMDAHDQINKSEKMKEIIKFWLDNCPDRVEGDIKRKKSLTIDAKNFGR